MSQFHSLTIRDVRQETRDSVSLAFDIPNELNDKFQFIQGQYLTIRTQLNGEEVRRSYSICTGINDNEIRIGIKKVSGGLFSTYANEELKVGDELEVMAPAGNFYIDLDANREGHYLAVAAGSGITPILSIVKSTLEIEPNSTVTLLYGNRSSSSTMFREQLEELKNQYMGRLNLVFIFSREQQDVDLYNGHIDAEKCKEIFGRWLNVADLDASFICGPQEMTETVRDMLIEAGSEPDRIFFELFATSGNTRKREEREAAAAVNKATSAVTVIADGRALEFELDQNTDSILEAGNKIGAELPFSCKAGVCSTCKCKVIEGEVDMDVNFGLEDYEIEAGYILSCQSFPVSEKVVVDFDHI